MMATISTPISPQHQHAEHVDDENVRAELAEMEDALLGDDAADQEGDQHDDRNRAKADLLDMIAPSR